jgi:FkbM family methyltransferase
MTRSAIRLAGITVTGLLIGCIASWAMMNRPIVNAVWRKSFTSGETCPWRNLVKLPMTASQFDTLQTSYAGKVKVLAEDKDLGIEQIASPTRSFWIKKSGSYLDGKATLIYILAEEDWIMSNADGNEVQSGDVVVDVGAHIGTFGDDALRRGAGKVVMVEPDPINVECIRRNFKAEIADGRVVIVPEGAWSSAGTLPFHIGVANSGTGSFVVKEADSKVINVRTRPLDEMLAEIGVKKVNFIKMDIEGAEREALKGAAQTLKSSHPRLMLDSYHLQDDPMVLPAIVRGIRPDYTEFCAICSFDREDHSHVIPSAIFFNATGM